MTRRPRSGGKAGRTNLRWSMTRRPRSGGKAAARTCGGRRGRPVPCSRSVARGTFPRADGQPVGLDRAEIAQSVEHATENRGVASSILALGTKDGWRSFSSGSGSVGRASPCQGEGRGFESRLPLHSLHGADLNGPVPQDRASAPSSSGRTADFESVNRGSNPRGAANHPGGRRELHMATW